MIKKVVIFAAGRGTRMLDLAKDKPKHLIEVNNKPFLYYLLDNLKQAGFSEIIMVVGYKPEFMTDFVKNFHKDIDIKIINQFDILGEDEYGTACPLKCVKDLIGDESFLAINGDNLYSVEDLRRFNIDDKYNYIAGLPHECPEKYGVLQAGDDNFLESVVEKPEKPISNLINTGLYKFTPGVFNYLSKITLSPRGEHELTDVVNLLAKEKKVKTMKLKGIWLDLGKPDDVKKVEEYLNAKKNN